MELKEVYKNIIALVMLALIALTPVSSAVALSISNVQVQRYSTSAVVSWDTDIDANSFVNYSAGTTSQIVSDPTITQRHNVLISNLAPETQYGYQVASLATVEGTPQEASSDWAYFTTTPSGEDKLFLDAEVPTISTQVLSFSIQTLPNTRITARVNGDTHYATIASANGTANINGLNLEVDAENTVTLDLIHPSAGSLTREYVVRADTKAPTIHLIRIPSITKTGSIWLNGTTDEEIRLEVLTRSESGISDIVYDQKVDKIISTSIPLDDGKNIVRITASDNAGNTVSLLRTVYVDTEPPTILENNLADLTPTYSPHVTVKGKVSEPNITVRVYVNPDAKAPILCSDGIDNDGDGLIDYLRDPGCSSADDMSEQDLTNKRYACNDGIDNDADGYIDFLEDPGCDEESDTAEEDLVASEQECNDGMDNDGDGTIDYLSDKGCSKLDDASEDSESKNQDYEETTADSDGYFEQEISLGSYISASNIKISEADKVAANERTNLKNRNSAIGAGISYNSTPDKGQLVKIVAIDKVGQQATEQGYITYASCSSGGEWNIIQDAVYPAMIQPDLLFEGAAQLSMEYTFEYFGAGSNPYISSIDFTRYEVSNEESEDFAPDMILDGDHCQVYPEGGTDSKAYVVCNLQKYPPERFRNITAAYEKLEEMESLTFPLKMNIDYTYVDPYTNRQISKTQQTCIDIQVFLDRRMPPDKIPEGLLEDSVRVLNGTIDTIDQILVPLNTITLVTTGACLASTVALFFQSTQLEYQCLGLGTTRAAGGLGKVALLERALKGSNDPDSAIKAVCGEGQQDDTYGSALGSSCEQCGQAIAENIKMQKYYAYVCDRIFCPATPTAQGYIKQINKNPASQARSACSLKTSGNPLIDSYIPSASVPLSETTFKKDEGCGKEYYDQWASSCLTYSFAGGNIVDDSIKLEDPDANYNILQSFFNAMNSGICKEDAKEDGEGFRQGDNTYVWDEDRQCYVLGEDQIIEYNRQKEWDKGGEEAYTTQKAVFFQPENTNNIQGFKNDTDTPCVSTDNEGYLMMVPQREDGNPAFFDKSKGEVKRGYLNQESNKNAYTESVEVQRIRTEGGKDVVVSADNGYYTMDRQSGELTPYSPSRVHSVQTGGTTQYYAGDPGKIEGKPDVANQATPVKGPGRLRSKGVPDILIKSSDSFINSVRCVCLPSMQGYLEQIRNILIAIRNCFQGVLVTKEFNEGMCKAVLTQYLCDWIFEALGCFIKGQGQTDEQLSRDNDAFSKGFTSIARAGKRVKDYSYNRYGSNGTFNTLFKNKKLQHMVCLAAFGYDWMPELESAVKVSGKGAAINTTSLVYPATRRFMSANPFDQGKATFVYHIGYFLSAGDDINYRVELVCSTDSSCNSDEGFMGGHCDCSWPGQVMGPGSYPQTTDTSRNYYRATPGTIPTNAGGEQVYLIDEGFLPAGKTTEGKGEIYKSITAPIRYDKVRVTWNARRSTKEGGMSGTAPLVPISSIGDLPPVQCAFNLILMQFACNYVVTAGGEVHFRTPPTLTANVYNPGDKLNAILDVVVEYPEGTQPSQRVPKYAQLRIVDHLNRPITAPFITSKGDLLGKMPIKLPEGNQGIPLLIASKWEAQPGTKPLGVDKQVLINRNAIQGTFSEKTLDILVIKTGNDITCLYRLFTPTATESPFPTEIKDFGGDVCTIDKANKKIHLGKEMFVNAEDDIFNDAKTNLKFGSRISFKPSDGFREACAAGQSQLEYKAIISLHDSVAADPRKPVDDNNARFSAAVADYKGTAQEVTIPFIVQCPLGTNLLPACDKNKIISRACSCADNSCTSTGGLYQTAYCASDNTCKNIPQDRLKACPTGVATSQCWCGSVPDAQEKLPLASVDTTGKTVCDKGDTCSNSQCIPPATSVPDNGLTLNNNPSSTTPSTTTPYADQLNIEQDPSTITPTPSTSDDPLRLR